MLNDCQSIAARELLALRGVVGSLRGALPEAPLVKGPWAEVKGRLEEFYGCSPARGG
jgi:hypothetical protein